MTNIINNNIFVRNRITENKYKINMSAILLSIPIVYILSFMFLVINSKNKRKTVVINLLISILYILSCFIIPFITGYSAFNWLFCVLILVGIHSLANLIYIIYTSLKKWNANLIPCIFLDIAFYLQDDSLPYPPQLYSKRKIPNYFNIFVLEILLLI